MRKIVGLQENEKSKYEILSSKVGIQDLHLTGYSIMISFGPKIMDYSTGQRYPSNANAKHAHVFCVNAFSKTG